MIAVAGLSYKEQLVEELLDAFDGRPARVLDLGCGNGQSLADALVRHPNVLYTGVDQNAASMRKARATIGHYENVTLRHGFGETFGADGFDLVMSLSVLEHVKRLRSFLATSVRLTKPGGRLVHRYDLGHALAPSSPGERLRVAVARRLPAAVPAARFTTYPDQRRIVDQLRELGIDDIRITQGQMPGLKGAMNHIDRGAPASAELVKRIIELERDLWQQIGSTLDEAQRDRLFPAITIAGRRRHAPAMRMPGAA